jgi:hypothetical protein
MTIEKTKKGVLSVTSMNRRDCEKLMVHYTAWVPLFGVRERSKLWMTSEEYTALGPSPHVVKVTNQLQATFGESFLELYDRSEVTPYIHIAMVHMVDHLVYFQELWLYSNENFEAGNKRQRFWFGSSTQRGGVCGGRNQHLASHKHKGRLSCSWKQLMF